MSKDKLKEQCNCSDNCTCGEECNCTEDNKCNDNCTCYEDKCSCGDNCECGDTCECEECNCNEDLIEDLTKDPAFVNYCSNLSISANQQITTQKNTPENSLPSNPLDDYGDKMLNEMLINERHYK